jgi:hypothetical protein
MSDRVKIQISGKTYEKCPEDSCTIVNIKHYEYLWNAILNWNTEGYVNIYWKEDNVNKIMPLHRYVVKHLEGTEIPKNYVVHHINADRYDNDINNLEVVTYAQNNAAIVRKKISSDTKYKGIHFSKLKKNWIAQIAYNQRTYHLGAFDTDKDAAFKYDIAFYAIHKSTNGSNKMLDDDMLKKIDANRDNHIPTAKYDNRELPKYVIQLPSGSYRLRIRPHKIDIVFNKLEEAQRYIDEFHKQQETEKLNRILSQSILRNEDGIAIVQVQQNDKHVYALVDDDNYYALMKHIWSLDKSGYAYNRYVLMHRMIMNCSNLDGTVIDHINLNKLDNRKSNLRFSTASFNVRNRAKKDNCSSKYIGVYWRKNRNKWGAYITVDGVRKSLGCYENEEDAAEAYKNTLLKLEQTNTAETAEELELKLA